MAHIQGLGVIVLTLMSNFQAKDLMLETKICGQPYYLYTTKLVRETEADGCVVGLTSFVKDDYIKKIQELAGDKAVFLMQGIGHQGGEVSKIRHAHNMLVSLGRTVIYSHNPKEVVKEYCETFKKLL
jgi:orotidine-5'-phosphate decarboxylase